MRTTVVATGAVASAACGMLLGFLPGCPPPPPPPVPLDGVTVGLESIAQGLTSPVALAFADDGTDRTFIVDQIGRIGILDAQGNLLPEPFLDIGARMVALTPAFDERGLLSLVFHPNFAQTGRFFVVYNAPLRPADPQDFNSVWRLSEFRVSVDNPNLADPGSEISLLEILKPQFNHNGGQLLFGPDGLLYVTIGDGGGANDVGLGHTDGTGNAQDLTRLLGKMMRFNADTPGVLNIPPDNPFVADPTARDEIFAYGLRNPWRCSFDIGGENRLFCSDAGQNLFEEIDIIEAGRNYGWNLKEGAHCFDPQNPTLPPDACSDVGADGRPLIDPIIEYSHLDPAGLPVRLTSIGGYVYRGSAVPALSGRYVFADYSSSFFTPDGTLFVAEADAGGNWSFNEITVATSDNGRVGRFVLAFGQDPTGEIYVLTSRNLGPTGTTGEVFRVVPSP